MTTANEPTRQSRRTVTFRRTRYVMTRLTMATAISVPMILAGADIARATERIAVNHNESVGRDGLA